MMMVAPRIIIQEEEESRLGTASWDDFWNNDDHLMFKHRIGRTDYAINGGMPLLLYDESVAFHDRRVEDLEFDQRFRPLGSLFFELYNPQSLFDPPTGTFFAGNGTLIHDGGFYYLPVTTLNGGMLGGGGMAFTDGRLPFITYSTDPRAKKIALKNTQAEELAAILKETYADRMIGGSDQPGRTPSPQEFMQMLRGGDRRGGNQEEPQKMVVGVDARTNSIVLMAPEPLFSEVARLSQDIDAAALRSGQTLQIVSPRALSADTVQMALGALVGRQAELRNGMKAIRADTVSGGQIGSVRIENLEGLDVLILKGHEHDRARVMQAINDFEWRRERQELMMTAIDKSHIRYLDDVPIIYPDTEVWRKLMARHGVRYSSSELAKQRASGHDPTRVAELLQVEQFAAFAQPPAYETPKFSDDWAAFADLTAYAPGLHTSAADVCAAVEAETEPHPAAKPGRIDKPARRLIEAARAAGWQTATIELVGQASSLSKANVEQASSLLTGDSKSPLQAQQPGKVSDEKQPGRQPYGEQPGRLFYSIDFDGTGRFRFERTTGTGLREQVICDGANLWHLYPDLGIGRPPGDEPLPPRALGASDPLGASARGGYGPRGRPRDRRREHRGRRAARAGALERQGGQAAPLRAAALALRRQPPGRAAAGRNAGRQSAAAADIRGGWSGAGDGRGREAGGKGEARGDERGQSRFCGTKTGTVPVEQKLGQSPIEWKIALKPCGAPSLTPDVSKLVVLPLPVRSRASLEVSRNLAQSAARARTGARTTP